MTIPDADKPEDQRKFPRIPKSTPIEAGVLTYPVSNEKKEAGTSKNISGGGICILSAVSYPKGTALNLSIRLNGWQEYKRPFSLVVDLSEEAPLTVIGEVVWCRPARENAEYEIGIKFLNIYEDDFKALTAYLGGS